MSISTNKMRENITNVRSCMNNKCQIKQKLHYFALYPLHTCIAFQPQQFTEMFLQLPYS